MQHDHVSTFGLGNDGLQCFNLLFSLRGNMHLPDYFERSLLSIEFVSIEMKRQLTKNIFML